MCVCWVLLVLLVWVLMLCLRVCVFIVLVCLCQFKRNLHHISPDRLWSGEELVTFWKSFASGSESRNFFEGFFNIACEMTHFSTLSLISVDKTIGCSLFFLTDVSVNAHFLSKLRNSSGSGFRICTPNLWLLIRTATNTYSSCNYPVDFDHVLSIPNKSCSSVLPLTLKLN